MKSSFIIDSSINFNNTFKELLANSGKFDTKNKKYFCLNFFNIGCEPCLSEIPLLNTIFSNVRKDTALIYVTKNSNAAATNILHNINIDTSNMIIIGNMDNLIDGIFNEIGLKSRVYPINVVVDKKGNILAFLIGNIENRIYSVRLTNFI